MGKKSKGKGPKKKKGGKKSPPHLKCQTSLPVSTTTQTIYEPHSPLPFEAGTRIECYVGDEKSQEKFAGTVASVWHDCPDCGLVYYKIRLDNGGAMCVTNPSADAIWKSDLPPLFSGYSIGTRVECKLGSRDKWFAGTVVEAHQTWYATGSPLYHIEFDFAREKREFFGPRESIRQIPEVEMARPDLRFKVGDRVDCAMGNMKWESGTVIDTWYRGEEKFENGYSVPYQIQLDDGTHIYAPIDEESCIMKSSTPSPECWICFDNHQSESNPIVRQCACRGGTNGFVHVKCLVKFARGKVGTLKSSDDPFFECITCKQEFAPGLHIHEALVKEYYSLFGQRDVEDTRTTKAIASMSEMLVRNERGDDVQSRYRQAKEILVDGVQKVASRMREECSRGRSGYAALKYGPDMLRFFISLASVHDKLGDTTEMKSNLDSALGLLDKMTGPQLSYSRVIINAKLSKHAFLRGNKSESLDLMEKTVRLERKRLEGTPNDDEIFLSNLLYHSGNLNLEILGNAERCVEQLSEAFSIQRKIYGSNDWSVRNLAAHLEKIRNGIVPEWEWTKGSF